MIEDLRPFYCFLNLLSSAAIGSFIYPTQVSLESWLGGYENLYDSLRAEYPTLSPLDLGTIGYSGEESIYVSGKVRQTAYGDSGLALDFYRSYNTSHHDPKQHLGGTSSLAAFARSRVAMC